MCVIDYVKSSPKNTYKYIFEVYFISFHTELEMHISNLNYNFHYGSTAKGGIHARVKFNIL